VRHKAYLQHGSGSTYGDDQFIIVVSADTYPDAAVTLAKHHNHWCASRNTRPEFFYNAAIAAPASPLAKIPQQTLTLGCASAASVVQTGQSIIWLSRNQNGGLGIHKMTGGQLRRFRLIR